MIETITVEVNGKKYQYNTDTTLYEISRDFQDDHKFPILIARVGNRLKELNDKVNEDCKIEFLDLTSKEGNRIHVNGLTYILLYAVKKLYGRNSNIIVQHSLDKGLYIETSFRLTEEKVKEIKEMMKSIIKADMPIIKVTIDRIEAMKYFENVGDMSKAGVITYNTNNYITLYRLGSLYNYFYDIMPFITGVVKDFDLTYINNKSLVLRFPTIYINEKIKKYKHHPQMFDVFNEYDEWTKLMHLENASDLNRIVSEGRISDLIKIDETLQSNRLLGVAKAINNKRNKVKIVLLAGPSSSGKTTTSKKLRMYLQSFGLNPKVISMDDYFVELDETPKDETGKYDFECLEAVDLNLFDKTIGGLLDGKNVKIPTYNFALGHKEFNNTMQLEEKDILVIEGIHALDPKILTNIPREKKFKIYISPLTELSLDDHNRIPTTDNRLLRRIVRDARTRNYPVEKTFEQWPSVRNGEEKYIFPYQDEPDVTINSAAIYEIGVLKTYAEPLLYSVKSDSPQYEEAKRLINILRLFLPIPSDSIPEDSVFREFIGGSYFENK